MANVADPQSTMTSLASWACREELRIAIREGTVITGRCGAGLHAETDVIRQAKGRPIAELYTEREPCDWRCVKDLMVHGIGPERVTFSVPWNRPAVHSVSNTELQEMIRNAFAASPSN